ncbi:MAG: hypothetical protein MUO85_07015 [candidate division Zixibacteria bacterium]|nr:hypothetical protein [candidate division Zixibacteria bacterium]
MSKKYLLRTRLLILSVFISLFLLMQTSLAKEDTLPLLNTKPKTIAVFKNGLGFFIRDGEVSLKDGWGVTEYVPNATLGSIWIGCLDKDATLEEAIAFKEEIKNEIEAISIEELLKANIGEDVIIDLNNKIIKGKIISVPEDREIEKNETARYDYRSGYTYPYTQQIQPATFVIIDTKEGKVALNKNAISKIEFPNLQSTKIVKESKAKRIKFKVGTQKSKARLSLSYLQKGISWVPSYLVNIENPKKARITMKATLINDVEDLENVDVYFVVGYPNFVYADVLSPMALEQSITQFISTLSAGGRRGRYDVSDELSNIMSQSVNRGLEEGFVVNGPVSPLDYGYAAIKGLTGVSEEDLFLYYKEGVSLKNGERAYYHIFSDEVDYKHIYEWEIPDAMKLDYYGYYRPEQQKEITEQVWHSIKLTNSTNYPWTTAPAFSVSSWKPLAQDIIDYTPKGAKTNLKLTVATDIKTDKHEYEIERQRDINLYHHDYDLITVKGELYAKNCKTEDVTMEIKKKLTGEVIEVSHNGKIKKTAEGLRGPNNNSIISWEIPLKAGEEVNITYKYKVYIAN